MEPWIVPTLLLALAVGLALGWWIAHARAAATVARLRTDLAERGAEAASARAERDAARSRVAEIAEDRQTLKEQFRALSAEQLATQGRQTSEQLVEPVAKGLQLLAERITAVEKERAGMAAELRQQISDLRTSGETLRRETLGLATALRTPQVRGSWGEQSLRRMVEVSGLTARVDFDEQPSTTTADGRQRPDMVVHLAGGKEVFVDAKVPLAAVLDAYNTEDEAEQAAHLDRFARHVRQHIDDLSGKRYWDLSLGSPEFVVLYLGSDEFYRLAQERMPDLHDYAARRNVMLASPGILIPLLHIVAHGWSQASLAESAAEVVRLGRELHNRLQTMGGHFAAAGRGLNQAVTNYNKAIASLESRVLVSARRFTDLDVTTLGLDELGTVAATAVAPSAPELTDGAAPSSDAGPRALDEGPGPEE
ncbi:DNA recombination protein RmuC [uncultured Tessaracoccus sp.]|uniref:DNA recombination protein RmuC n=1 Tax=uncultured Tessaracoccus sp. TaxID=905023 RepID=UPI0025F2F034|nr:DNA recombination protein RmuC [uncultured Tessaracoccus sp.]